MEGLIVLLVLALIFLLVIWPILRHSQLVRKLDEQKKTLNELNKVINNLQLKVVSLKSEEQKPVQAPVVEQKPVQAPVIEQKPISPVVEQKSVPPVVEQKPVMIPIEKEPVRVPTIAAAKPRSVPPPVVFQKPRKPTFFEKNPDLEKFIGENLINKIGIGILVLGIGFFVKYAIDQNWVNEIGRTCIGLLCGSILIALAHKLHKNFAAFSSVLIAGGIAVLYFTISIAFHEYHLINQVAAFGIMVVITVFAIVFSIAYNRQELAVLAIIGGFSSPFMVSTGSGNYIVLFTYIAILNIGMLVLAYLRKWNIINIVSYLFTIILYGGFLIKRVIGIADAPYIGAFLFGTVFYVLFFLMNVINNIKEARKFRPIEIVILLSNTFFYYAAGFAILTGYQNKYGIDFKGLFTALVSVFNFVFAVVLYKNKNVDRTLVYLIIGLVLTFLSLAAPVQLEGNYITLFWAAESVLLLWLSQKSGIKLMKVSSVVVMGLMCISLFMDWKNVYFSGVTGYSVMLNKGFVTNTVSIMSLVGTIFLLKNEDINFIFSGILISAYRGLLSAVIIVFIYLTVLLELNYHLSASTHYAAEQSLIIGCYSFLFILGLIVYANKKNQEILSLIATIIGCFCLLFYVIYYHMIIIEIRDTYLNQTIFESIDSMQQVMLSGYLIHYILTALVLLLLYFCFENIRKLNNNSPVAVNALVWTTTIILLFVFSAELDHIMMVGSSDKYLGFSFSAAKGKILSQSHKAGYAILWGVSSFILMVLGMRKKMRMLRVVSLSLFLLTLLKLFIVDIRGISEGGKIAAFILLGVLLLIISFMYQKLKHIILEDDKEAK